jgi:hypothetical protein
MTEPADYVPSEHAAIWAWHNAYLGHRRRLRAEAARYAAECQEVRGEHGPPAGTDLPIGRKTSWHQAGLDELDPPRGEDEVIFARPDGTWFAADAAQYLPPCEMAE